MSGNAAFTGNIPEFYDQGLGPIIFVDYAEEMARRAAVLNPKRVLETAAGTGIVTRRLRDGLPADVQLTATDLNPPMIEVARAKFVMGRGSNSSPPMPRRCPFPTKASISSCVSSA